VASLFWCRRVWGVGVAGGGGGGEGGVGGGGSRGGMSTLLKHMLGLKDATAVFGGVLPLCKEHILLMCGTCCCHSCGQAAGMRSP
jgi:hypothetical protein